MPYETKQDNSFRPLPLEILWMLGSLVLTLISFHLKQSGPVYTGGFIYISAFLGYLFVCLLFLKFNHHKEDYKFPRLHFFILGCLPIFFTDPLFENDHFRYLWEGKAWLEGFNPYQVAADDQLISVERDLRSKVAYSNLTSVYPLFAQAYFFLTAFLKWEWGLRLLQVVNALMVFVLLRKIDLSERKKSFLVALSFFFFQKEFIQSVHIDLFAIFCFFLFYQRRNFLWGILVSMFIKLISVVLLPFLFLPEIKKWTTRKQFISVLLVGMTLLYIQVTLLGDIQKLSGVHKFSSTWIWNPGFYSVLIRLFPEKFELMRLISFSCWGGAVLGILYFAFKRRQESWIFERSFVLIFSSMMFFSPVYNSWYSIWILLPSLILGLKWGTIYSLMSCWSYFYHGMPNMVWLSELCSHILIFPVVREVLQLEVESHKVELQEELPNTQNFAQ